MGRLFFQRSPNAYNPPGGSANTSFMALQASLTTAGDKKRIMAEVV